MARTINGALYVESFNSTDNAGEYTFENALFNNQADTSGNGAYDITPGFVIFIPATDRNSITVVPGISIRYTVTNITYIDTVRISGTIIWDNVEEEIYTPTNGVFCLISQTTPHLKLAVPPVDNLYPEVTPGSTLSAMLNDLINIMDKLSANSSSSHLVASVTLPIVTNGQVTFTLPYLPLNPVNVLVTVNGMKYSYGSSNDFTISGTTLSWTDVSIILETTDSMTISYAY